MNALGRALLVGWGMIAVAIGCSSSAGPDSETHWLRMCMGDADCGGGLSCICSTCTRACTADTCGILGASAKCVTPAPSAVAAGCQTAATATAVCTTVCKRDADCAALGSALHCIGGACLAGSPTQLPDGGIDLDPLVATWIFSGRVPALVAITLTFNSDKTLTFVEEVAPPTTPAGFVPDGCVTTDSFSATYAETVSGGVNTLTWTFKDGTANAVSGCNTASNASAGTPMTAAAIEDYRAQGLIPPTTETYAVTSTTLVLTPTVSSGAGLSTSTTFTKSR